MNVKLNHNRAVILMVLVTLMWSSAGVVTRHIESARSFEMTFWRAFFTALSLLVILPLWRGVRVFKEMGKGGLTLWISALCWCVMFTAFMVALTLTTVANVLVTMSIAPLLTAVIARVFIGHKIPTRTVWAIGAAGAGIVFMYATQLTSDRWMGSLVALCVPLASATNWTVTQHAHAQSPGADMVPAVLMGAVASCLLTLPFSIPFQASAHDLALLAGLGLGQLAIPCALSVMCASVLKAPEIALLALLEVVFGIALAWMGAGEVPGMPVLVGGAIVIGALSINEWLGMHQRRTAT